MITITNEDNMVLMARYPNKHFDLAIVDPPYGNSTDVMNIKDGRDNLAKRTTVKGYDNIAPGPEYFEELKRVSKRQIIWGANFFGMRGGVYLLEQVWNRIWGG